MRDVSDPRSPSERLLAFRGSLGLQQQDLAQRIGVSVGTLGFAERGDRSPSKALMHALFDHYGLSANWLLFGAGEPFVEGAKDGLIPEQASEGDGARQNGAPSDTGPGGVGAPSGPTFWDRQLARGPLELFDDFAGAFFLTLIVVGLPFALPILAELLQALTE